MSDRPSTARSAKGWALYTRTGWIFTESVRCRRREVVQYADMDAAPGWNWVRYRKNGFFIAKVDIVPIAPTYATGEKP